MMSTQYNKITSPWHLNTCIFQNFPGAHLKARGIHDTYQVVLIKYPIYNFTTTIISRNNVLKKNIVKFQ